MQTTAARPKVTVSGDGRGVVGHGGTRRLVDLADVTGLSGGFSDALGLGRQRRSGHDPGSGPVDLAVLLPDGGQAIADLAVLRDQSELFGVVASDATAGVGDQPGAPAIGDNTGCPGQTPARG